MCGDRAVVGDHRGPGARDGRVGRGHRADSGGISTGDVAEAGENC
jgi:hypothetical protein